MLSKGIHGFVLSRIVWAITIAVLELLTEDGRHSEPGHYSHIVLDKKDSRKSSDYPPSVPVESLSKQVRVSTVEFAVDKR